MSFVLQKSKSGSKTIEINGRLIHSLYSPEKEAFRFISQLYANEKPNLIILFGAGLGYIHDAIKKIYPHARVFLIFFHSEVFHNCSHKNKIGNHSWHPEKNQDLFDSLNQVLHDYDYDRVMMIKWEPSIQAFPQLAKISAGILHQSLSQLKGSFRTIQGFGKNWISNSFMNYVSIQKIISGQLISPEKFPVLAASGYSLKESITFIKAYRNYIQLIALPSSLSILNEYEITPDVIVVTDPGFYSAYHFRFHKFKNPVIAMPLSAAKGIYNLFNEFYLFHQPHFFETSLLQYFNHSFLHIPPQGTVAASALALILAQTNTPCFVTGLDLAFMDIHGHVIPNSFYDIQLLNSTRLRPLYSNLFKNAVNTSDDILFKDQRISKSLKLYADYFNLLPTAIKKRIYITEHEKMLKGFQIFDEKKFSMNQFSKAPVNYNKLENIPSHRLRKNQALLLLDSWLKDLDQNSNTFHFIEELFYFINPIEYSRFKHHQQYKEEALFENSLNLLKAECSDYLYSLKNKIKALRVDF
ncbi:MAG: motility associated factor glycosyltransferase family protein [Spirochaetales bacterium]|nr:motility associated factor glycosyltransferase family protein [Spirochaetales bacterium]